MLSQGAREGGVIGSHGEDAGNHKNRWPASHGKIANLGPIPGEHDVAGIHDGIRVTSDHAYSFFILTTGLVVGDQYIYIGKALAGRE